MLIRLQVQGGKERVDSFRPLPDGSWAVPLRGDGIRSYPKISRAWWPKIAEEYAASRTIYLILQKGKREQAQNSERSMECSDV